MNTKKLIFFGTSDFSVPALKALATAGYEISLVVTTPDEPVGRKQLLTPPPIKTMADSLGLRAIQPKSLKKDLTIVDSLSALSPDFAVVASYGKIIPQAIIDLFPQGMINIHPSLLPKYRGPSPIQSVLLNGEKETGVCIIQLDAEVDHGAIIARQELGIMNNESCIELSERLAKVGADLLIKALPGYLSGDTKPQEQDHTQATFTKKFTSEDGKIDWQKSAEEINNQIRALNPEPGTFCLLNDEVLKIIRAIGTSEPTGESPVGSLVQQDKKLLAVTGNGILEILELQPAGKKPMSAQDFTNGYRESWPIRCYNFWNFWIVN